MEIKERQRQREEARLLSPIHGHPVEIKERGRGRGKEG
jgi:hypothetical protein